MIVFGTHAVLETCRLEMYHVCRAGCKHWVGFVMLITWLSEKLLCSSSVQHHVATEVLDSDNGTDLSPVFVYRQLKMCMLTLELRATCPAKPPVMNSRVLRLPYLGSRAMLCRPQHMIEHKCAMHAATLDMLCMLHLIYHWQTSIRVGITALCNSITAIT